jgi:hypothetical protein
MSSDKNPLSYSFVECWFCGCKMRLAGNFKYKDFGRKGEGDITLLSCSQCDASAEFSLPSNKDTVSNDRTISAAH